MVKHQHDAAGSGFRFIGAFAKLRKATIRLVMSVRLYASNWDPT